MTRFMRFTPPSLPADKVGELSRFAAQMAEHLHPGITPRPGTQQAGSLKVWEGEGGIVVDLSPLPPHS